MRKKKPGNRLDPEWEEAKRLCRLSEADVRKAKEVGLKPRSILKNRPSKSQPWKAPVPIWIGQLHDRMLARSARKRERKESRSPLGEPESAIGRADQVPGQNQREGSRADEAGEDCPF